ncbi:unnamed protein product [Prorocentrum cordatum]|uniref:Uncharacterized protein n=1 Tax=Prorocentrum cordatum TaxID=2364126 RepID=A0ABN9T9L9_9DINO|nr:unnamed protein product [Polarella glacialis]
MARAAQGAGLALYTGAHGPRDSRPQNASRQTIAATRDTFAELVKKVGFDSLAARAAEIDSGPVGERLVALVHVQDEAAMKVKSFIPSSPNLSLGRYSNT